MNQAAGRRGCSAAAPHPPSSTHNIPPRMSYLAAPGMQVRRGGLFARGLVNVILRRVKIKIAGLVVNST